MTNLFKYFALIISVSFISCNEIDEEKVNKNRELLDDKEWGLPNVIHSYTTDGDIFLNYPIIFNEDGTILVSTIYAFYWQVPN